MLTNNYIASLIVKDHRKRLLEEARKVGFPEEIKDPESKHKIHQRCLKIGNSLKLIGLQMQKKKI